MTDQRSGPPPDARGIPPDLPPRRRAYTGFAGRVGRTIADSQSWWPPRATAPRGAPNVLIVLCDDLGYADIGCFGSEIDTPQLDRLASEGLRYTDFHVTPMCSPTRAALLTGRHPHAAGVGYVAHADPGFPGLSAELADDVPTIAETLRDNGYATMMVGKWHLCKDSDNTDTGSKASWPLQRGFDRYYGFLGGMTDLYQPPTMITGNQQTGPDSYPDGYYLTDDLTDEAIRMITSAKASDPTKPVMLYLAHAAVHAPLHAKRADIDKYRGRYACGWDRLRESRFAKQIALGLLPDGTRLPPRNGEPGDAVPPWEDLDPDRQRVFARYMEVYAAMVDSIDQSLGRIRAVFEALGEWDNTLVLFLSDNGASREGEADGTMQYFDLLRRYHDKQERTDGFARDAEQIDLVGGPRSMPHYPRGWAMASNTPFRLYKINTHAGGQRVPAIVSWPARLRAQGGQLRHQFVHVTDVVPTLLELIGVTESATRSGTDVKPRDGVSFVATLDDTVADHRRADQVQEMFGNRGYRSGDWEIVTRHVPGTPFDNSEWELYDLSTDPTQCVDLADRRPETVRRLAAAWERAAWENQIFPLDERSGLSRLLRPERDEAYTVPVRILPGTPTLERYRSSLLIAMRSYRIVVELQHTAGRTGTLLAHGGQAGGYALYVDGDVVSYLHRAYGEVSQVSAPLHDRAREVLLDVTAVDPSTLRVALSVDGGQPRWLNDVPAIVGQALFQGIDVGMDRRSPVCWERRQRHGTYPYGGQLVAVRYEPGPPVPNVGPAAIAQLRAAALKWD